MLPNWQNFPVIPNVREMHQLPLISVDACLIFSHRLPQPHRPQQSWTMNTDWVTVSFSKAYLDAKERQRVSFPWRLWLKCSSFVLTTVNATHRRPCPCLTWYQRRKFSMSLCYGNCSYGNQANSSVHDVSAGVTSSKNLKPIYGVNTTAITFRQIKNHASPCRYAKSH
jgi:hypothetical protein